MASSPLHIAMGKDQKVPESYNSAYPKWMYTKLDGKVVGKIVNDPAALKALGDGWSDSPAGPFRNAPKKTKSRKRFS